MATLKMSVATLKKPTTYLQEIQTTAKNLHGKSLFPHIKSVSLKENWKYTNLTSYINFLNESPLSNILDPQKPIAIASQETLKSRMFKESYKYSEVILNNQVTSSQNQPYTFQPILDNNILEPFSQKIHLQLQTINNPTFYLNTSSFNGGYYLNVPKDISLADNIIYLFHGLDLNEKNHVYSKNIIEVEENSTVSILEHFYSTGKEQCVYNNVTDVILHPNAKLYYYKLNHMNENDIVFFTNSISQNRHSEYQNVALLHGSVISYHDYYVDAKSTTATNFQKAALGKNQQNIDSHLNILHKEPHSISCQIFRGISSDQAKISFRNRVYVNAEAQKTNAYQDIKMLLLGTEAIGNTKPQLEIYADDVKCQHGASIGHLQQEAIYYLKSRGISEVKAKKILTYSFIEELLKYISNIKVQSSFIREAKQFLY